MTYVTLLGAEDVSRAGHNMRAAAEGMQSAASQIDEAMRHHTQRMEELVARFEDAVERSMNTDPTPSDAPGVTSSPDLSCYTCGVPMLSYHSVPLQEPGATRYVKVCGPCDAKIDAREIDATPIPTKLGELGEPGGPQCSRCEPDQRGGYTCSQATCPSNLAGSGP